MRKSEEPKMSREIGQAEGLSSGNALEEYS